MSYIKNMSLKLCSISSGSKGNCIYVASSNTELVVDLGISFGRANRSIKLLGGEKVSNILLTHTHWDHYYGVECALKNGAKMYYNKISRDHIKVKHDNMIETSGKFTVGDISVTPFRVSHDVPCVGYTLKSGNSKVSIVTDLGYLPSECMDIITGSSMVVIESNYDEEMLKNNVKYSQSLKQRIQGTQGHLSNIATANAVIELVKNNVSNIMLAHLSEQNNTPELALKASSQALAMRGLLEKVTLSVAVQNEMSSLYEVI